MTTQLSIPVSWSALVLTTAIAAVTPAAAASNGFTVLHSFSGTDGASPNGLIQTSDGSFYGSTAIGGDLVSCPADGCGTLFKSDSAGNVTVLHVFHGTDGYIPTGLVEGSDGMFYGTTLAGGQPFGGGPGTIFRIDTAGTFELLYAFTGGFACCDGGGPTGPPIEASDGNFYGTTGGGGEFRDIHHQGGFGTVYQFNPVTNDVTVLHSFNFDGNGFYPNSPLIQSADGFLYGTTRQGGNIERSGPAVLFRIDTEGNFDVVGGLAGQPLSGVIQATDGSFYGTNEGLPGLVYRVDASGTLYIVNRFDAADGWNPMRRVLQASDGFLYGTAPAGGLLDFQGGDIFRLSTSDEIRILHSFTTTGVEGFSPNSELVEGSDGALYGVNGIGGAAGRGTIFRIDQTVLGPIASLAVSPTVIHAGQSATGMVTLAAPAPAGGTVVRLGAAQGQIVIPATVTVRAGRTTGRFEITALSIGVEVSVRIYASVAGQGTRTTITVAP
jgi:uncharacterized repeat protein (TIGR03803 family)